MDLEPLIGPEIFRRRESPIRVGIIAAAMTMILTGGVAAEIIKNSRALEVKVLTGVAAAMLAAIFLWFIARSLRIFLIYGERGGVRIRGDRIFRFVAYADLVGVSREVYESRRGYPPVSLILTLNSRSDSLKLFMSFEGSIHRAPALPQPSDRIHALATAAIADGMLDRIAQGRNAFWSDSVRISADTISVIGLFGGTKTFPIEDVAFGLKFHEEVPIAPAVQSTHLWLRGTNTVIATLQTGAENYYPGLLAFRRTQLARLAQIAGL